MEKHEKYLFILLESTNMKNEHMSRSQGGVYFDCQFARRYLKQSQINISEYSNYSAPAS